MLMVSPITSATRSAKAPASEGPVAELSVRQPAMVAMRPMTLPPQYLLGDEGKGSVQRAYNIVRLQHLRILGLENLADLQRGCVWHSRLAFATTAASTWYNRSFRLVP